MRTTIPSRTGKVHDAIGLDIPSISISHAELKSFSVAAASIVAKVVRDSLMEKQREHPVKPLRQDWAGGFSEFKS